MSPAVRQSEVRNYAREIVYIYEQVGYDRFRLAAGEEPPGGPGVAHVRLPEWSDADPIGLLQIFAVEKCPKIHIRNNNKKSTHQARTYRLTEDGVEVAREMLDNAESFLPCGHRGLSNPRGVDGYQCAWDGCDAVFDREEVQR